METKIGDGGRGTYLVWTRVQHAGNYIVGHIRDCAGLYCAPKLYRVTTNKHGGEYVMIYGQRVYITDNQI